MRTTATFALAALLLAAPSLAFAGDDDDDGRSRRDRNFCLTILHNNDGESQLLNAGSGIEDFGGADRFATVLRRERWQAHWDGCERLHSTWWERWFTRRGVITVSSGDNFLAGPEFNASLERGVPFFDSLLVLLLRYDALALGNHEFDFGPDALADFIVGTFGQTRFLSANLDFSQEPVLQRLVQRRQIAKSRVVRKRGRRIGIVGATTDELRSISSPRDVIINAVAPAVQDEIDRLSKRGVDIIVFISHLQSINEDIDLLAQLRGVDVAIAGGGDEVLANPGDLLVPGDTPFAGYPVIASGADGAQIPMVTTSGNYKYVGRLEVLFDPWGQVIQSEGGPVRVAGGANPDAVAPNRFVKALVVDPVADAVAALAQNIIGTTDVGLDGIRGNVRTTETNLGNLIADSALWQAQQLAAQFGVAAPDVALQNGGGIRNDDIRGPGDLSELDTFDILPFGNFVTIVPDIAATQLKQILENAVSRVEDVSGRFAQVAGLTLVYDPSGTAQVLDGDGNVVTPGTRVQDVTLDDGTVIVSGGTVTAGAPAVGVVVGDFLARGGDQYPFRGAPFTSIGVTDQQALRNYIEQALGGTVTAAQYPEGGEGRITP